MSSGKQHLHSRVVKPFCPLKTSAFKRLWTAGDAELTASNGQKAAELLRRHSNEIALGILDMIVPKPGGIGAAIQMRKLNPRLRVVFARGCTNEPWGQAVLEGETVLENPYTREYFLRSILEKLDF